MISILPTLCPGGGWTFDHASYCEENAAGKMQSPNPSILSYYGPGGLGHRAQNPPRLPTERTAGIWGVVRGSGLRCRVAELEAQWLQHIDYHSIMTSMLILEQGILWQWLAQTTPSDSSVPSAARPSISLRQSHYCQRQPSRVLVGLSTSPIAHPHSANYKKQAILCPWMICSLSMPTSPPCSGQRPTSRGS